MRRGTRKPRNFSTRKTTLGLTPGCVTDETQGADSRIKKYFKLV